MKPKNFPARKLARQIAADIRSVEPGKRTMRCRSPGIMTSLDVMAARAIRTKKAR